MKQSKWFAKVLIFIMMLTMALAMNAAAYATDGSIAGSGTEADPYVISDLGDLKQFQDNVNNGSDYSGKIIKLGNNIDLSNEEWTPIGNGTRTGSSYTGHAFKGSFDGNGKTISKLTIVQSSSNGDDAIGLFGVVDGGTIQNLTLADVNINAATSECAGGAIGLMVSDAVADQLTVSGAVSAKRGNGGIVGRMTVSGTISNCTNNASVSATGGANVGGIAGAAYYTGTDKEMLIQNCTNNGTVAGSAGSVGGIVGLSAANIEYCKNTAAIQGSGASIGGIAGEQQNYGSIIGCTNTATITNSAANEYGTGGIVGWVRYNGDATSYPAKEIIEVKNNINSGSITGGNDGGGIIGTLYNSGVVSGNENRAEKISGTTFAAGIVGNIQTTETPVGSTVPQDNYSVCNNLSATALENLTGSCKDLYAYNNPDADNSESKVKDNTQAWVAQVGDNNYATLAAAIDAANKAESDVTVKLLTDAELAADLGIGSSYAITLDLNGKTINGREHRIYTQNEGLVTISGGGVLKNEATSNSSTSYPLYIYSGSKVCLDDIKITGKYGVYTCGNLEIQKAEITTDDCALAVNQSAQVTIGQENSNNAENIAITSKGNCISTQASQGEKAMNVIINGGTFKSTDPEAFGSSSWAAGPIYWASHGTLTINDGVFIGGANASAKQSAAIYQKNGTVNINGGTFSDKDAVKVGAEQADCTEITLNITDGEFNGTRSAFYFKTTKAGSNCTVYEINISGGKFTRDNAGQTIYESTVTLDSIIVPEVKISGGNFGDAVKEEYCAEDFIPVKNGDGTFGVKRDLYTVTFTDDSGASLSSNQEIKPGGKATKPADPVKSGYIFKGWYSDKGLTASYDFEAVVNSDLTLYAKWEKKAPVPPTVSSDAALSGIVLDNGSISPTFDKNTKDYTAAVENEITSIKIVPEASDAKSTIKVNGETVPSGTAKDVALEVGKNTITVEVTAEDGKTVNTYTITVTRNEPAYVPSANADLTKLTLSKGALSPAFDTEKDSYTSAVPNSVKSIMLTPQAADTTAVITVNGKTVTSGAASEAISLKEGENIITVTVTAEDGKTVKTYTVNITRAAAKGKTYAVSSLNYKVTKDSITSGTVIFTGYKGNSRTKLAVPKTIKIYGITYKVVAVGDKACKGKSKLKTVTIGDNVTKIGMGAFYKCTSLKTITIGKNVASIGKHTFCHDTKLRTMTFNGSKLTKVGNHCLYKIKNLKIKAPKAKVAKYDKLFKGKAAKSYKVVKK